MGALPEKIYNFSAMPKKAGTFSVKNSKHCLCSHTGSDFAKFPRVGIWKNLLAEGISP
jgi:hypothetical protein